MAFNSVGVTWLIPRARRRRRRLARPRPRAGVEKLLVQVQMPPREASNPPFSIFEEENLLVLYDVGPSFFFWIG